MQYVFKNEVQIIVTIYTPWGAIQLFPTSKIAISHKERVKLSPAKIFSKKMLFYIIFSCQFKVYASEMLKSYLEVPRNGTASFFALIMRSTKDIHQ